jgi:hypothetical protein
VSLQKKMITKLFYSELKKKKEQLFNYPPLIGFDRMKQAFSINK